MSLIGNCSDCGTGGVSLRYKPETPVNEQSRPSICDRCRDFREEQATHYVPCEKCGDRVPSERAHSLDVTAEDEYYPEFIHFCPTCRPDANDDDADLMTDGGEDCQRATHRYKEVCKGMRPGLLISVNNSGNANAPGSGQLEVNSRMDDGEVLLTGYDDTAYRLKHDTPRGTVLIETHSGRKTYVETIEVLGVND